MNNRIYILISVSLLFLSMSSVSAQIGVKAGISISDIAFHKYGQTPYLGYEINSLEHRIPMTTFQVGAFGTIGLGKRIDFQPELLFTMPGLNYSTEYLYDDITYKINISYLNMPFLVKYKFSTKKKTQSALFIGPYVSWKLKAVRVIVVDGIKEKAQMQNVKNADLGVAASYAIDFNLPSGQIIADFRCSYGLMNMMDTIDGYIPWYYGPSKEYARNVNIALTVGYRFSTIWSKNAVKP